MRGHFKPWARPYLAEHPELVAFDVAPLEPAAYLEIGSGKGDFAVSYCLAHPDKRFIALERETNVCALFAKKAVEAELKNLCILPLDFDEVYEVFGEKRFERIFLNFSDPWPKKRHAKRRLTFAPRLKKIAALLEKGGQIVMKTDNVSLYEFTKEQIPEAGLLLVDDNDNYMLEEGDFMTEYERNFRSLGQPIYRLVIAPKEVR